MKSGVGLVVKVAGLGSSDPEFEPMSAVELTPGGVDKACHPSEVGEMTTNVLVIGALHQHHNCAFSHGCYSQPCSAYGGGEGIFLHVKA